ncbi:MAG: 4-hydroxy-tetrahydrodipicolinate reductase [Ignavibacteriales bacterium]|nr:4-hydroxy-tetrahydrodipicolinate reductase [Ignavibacteriales bacterium]
MMIPLSIAIIGGGKMGKEIEHLASERAIVVKKIFTRKNNSHGSGLTRESLNGVDVCLEFTTPSEAPYNIEAAFAAGKNVVCGTTGWLHQHETVQKLAEQHNVGFLYASNFSIGMNILYELVSNAAFLIDKFDDFDMYIHEVHHRNKLDATSGTALHLASILLRNVARKKEIIHDSPQRPLLPHQIHVTSTRAGYWAGQHKVGFDSETDSIELTHTARSRKGFAFGALMAAIWLKDKKGVYTMKDILL